MQEQAPEFDLSIVIPAFEEGRKIARDLHAAVGFLRARGLRGEVLVVDDGSRDDTAEQARRLQPDLPEVRVVAYHPNRGKGHAVRVGMEQARGAVVMFADAGLCVPYDAALMGWTMLRLDLCDIAQASRRVAGASRHAQPLYRRIGSKLYKLFVHAFMGIPLRITDTQCGFKLYKREVARRLFGQSMTDGFMFDVEIILRAVRGGDRIVEFPVPWNADTDSRYRPVRGTWRNLIELSRIRRALAEGA